MSWIAEYDTQGREFPTCVHVTKTTGTMTHGATYVPIEDGKAVRAENAKLRELVRDVFTIHWHGLDCTECPKRFQDRCTHLGGCEWLGILSDRMRELGVEV